MIVKGTDAACELFPAALAATTLATQERVGDEAADLARPGLGEPDRPIGPDRQPERFGPRVGIGYSITWPEVVIRAIFSVQRPAERWG